MELRLKSDTAKRKRFFTPGSFAHPAKLHLGLLEWIVFAYTSEGETILDPMLGSGTILYATLMGRSVVGVELESKFVSMAEDNLSKLNQMPLYLGTKQRGQAHIIQGDARNLEGLLCDKIITSPPYSESLSRWGGISQKEVDKRLPQPYVNKIITSPPYAETGASGPSRSPFWDRLAEDPTSARYGREKHPSVGEGYSPDKQNIGNLPYGDIDKIITSPPFGSLEQRGGGLNKDPQFQAGCKWDGYSTNSSNIGNLPYGNIDKIITSPPYEEGGQGVGTELHPERMVGSETGLGRGYPGTAGNIGNLKSDSYLEAMALVYSQCFTVLRDGGLLILVTKNFIRDKHVIRLDSDTIKLCEQVGFSFVERHYRKLPAQSFWRTIYKQKYPDVEEILYEDVLVFGK